MEKTPHTFIYGLFDRRAPAIVMYVGKATNPRSRLKQHLRKSSSRRMRTWLLDAKVGMRILQRVPIELWQAHETWWVSYWRQRNPGLLNVMPGGQAQGRTGRVAPDLTGQRFGRWTVVEKSTGGMHQKWFCRCDCGTIGEVAACDLLRTGKFNGSKSCGCSKPKAVPRKKKGWDNLRAMRKSRRTPQVQSAADAAHVDSTISIRELSRKFRLDQSLVQRDLSEFGLRFNKGRNGQSGTWTSISRAVPGQESSNF